MPNASLNSDFPHKECTTLLFEAIKLYILYIVMHCTSGQNNSSEGYSRVIMYNRWINCVDTSSNGYNCYHIPHLIIVCYHIVDFAHGHAQWLNMSPLYIPHFLN